MKKLRVIVVLPLVLLLLFSTSVTADDHIEGTEEIILPLSDLPEVIDREDAIARGHVARLKNEETDMYSVIFRNEDGTKSLYMFSSPVKYEDEQGIVRDKSTVLTQSSAGYALSNNDVNLNFGSSVNSGVEVRYAQHVVNINPVTNAAATGFMNNNTMVYNGAFGSNTMLYYTPLLSGFKSTILMRSSSDVNSFSFLIDTDTTTAVKENDGVVYLKDCDDAAVFECGTFIVTDSNGKYYEDEMLLQNNADGTYTVTATIDEAFLSAEDIAYPLIIEPSFIVSTPSSIDDAVIYSLRQNKNYGSYKYHNVGYLDSTYGVGRLLVKFPGLENNATFNSIQYNQFRKAEFNIYTASGNQQQFIMHAYRQEEASWSESTVTWNSFFAQAQGYDSYMKIDRKLASTSAAQKLTLNVSSSVKTWYLDRMSLQRGLLLRAENETVGTNPPRYRDFCSSEYAEANNGSLMPYLEIVYDTSGYVPVNISILFDGAFGTRCLQMFPNASNHIAQRVDMLMEPVVDYYKNNFGIKFNYTTQLTSSYLETSGCSKMYNLNSICTCYTKCATRNGNTYTPQHHTNQDLAISIVPSGNQSTHINMMLYGHKTCLNNEDSELCSGNGNLGVAIPAEHKVCIFSTDMSTPVNDVFIISTIIHELGHLYGADDHYGDHPDYDGSDEACIWGDETDHESNRMCPYCQNEIDKNILKYQHN